MSNIYPLDIDSLRHGQILTAEDLERLLGPFSSDSHRAMAIFQLQQRIEKDTDFTVVSDRGALRICTNEEAIEANRRRRDSSIRRILKSHIKLGHIDRKQLSGEDAARLDRERFRTSMFVSHLNDAKREIRAISPQQRLPKGNSDAEQNRREDPGRVSSPDALGSSE